MVVNLKRMLLVEASPADVKLALAALRAGRLLIGVVVLRDGEEALDYLFRRGQFAKRDEGAPAVVLLDLKLPKVTGLEVLEQIRKDADLHRIPVVMLTSSNDEKDLVRSYDLGVNAYVVKPVNTEEFQKAVQEIGLFWGVINAPAPDR